MTITTKTLQSIVSVLPGAFLAPDGKVGFEIPDPNHTIRVSARDLLSAILPHYVEGVEIYDASNLTPLSQAIHSLSEQYKAQFSIPLPAKSTFFDAKRIRLEFNKATDQGKSFEDALAIAMMGELFYFQKRTDNTSPDAIFASLESFAQQAAVTCLERQDYLPHTLQEASKFRPHRWVLDAMRSAIKMDRYFNVERRNKMTAAEAAFKAKLQDIAASDDLQQARKTAENLLGYFD